MLQAKRQPRLIVKLKSTNSRTRTQLRLGDPWPGQKQTDFPDSFSVQCPITSVCVFSLLPETLLHCLNCVHLLALHRQLLADTLLMDRPTMQNAGDTHTNTHFYSPLHIYKYIKQVCVFQNWSAVHFFPPSLCCWTNRTCWTLSGYIIFTSCRSWLLSTTLHVWLLITRYFCLLFQNCLSSCFCNTFTILVFGSHFCLLYFSREPGWRLRSEWAEDRRWGFFCFFCSVVPRTFSRGCSV